MINALTCFVFKRMHWNRINSLNVWPYLFNKWKLWQNDLTGRVVFEPSGTGLWPMSVERWNFIGPPGHSTETQRCQNITLWNSQQQNYQLEYSKLFSHVTETVWIDVTHDNALDTHLHFAGIKHFCLLNIQIS